MCAPQALRVHLRKFRVRNQREDETTYGGGGVGAEARDPSLQNKAIWRKGGVSIKVKAFGETVKLSKLLI
jgi:hypothetical protein